MKNEEVGKWVIAVGVIASLVVVIIVLVRVSSNSSSENFRVWGAGRGWGGRGWRRYWRPGWGWSSVNYNPTYVVKTNDFQNCYNHCIIEDCEGCGDDTSCTICHGKCAQKCQ
jgi:hypothetical protein